MLDFVLHPSSPDTSGMPVEDERLQKVTEWVSEQEDPIDGELRPELLPGPQRIFWRRACLNNKFTAALLNGIEPEDGGGVGTPFGSEGNGDCLLNSVAALFANEGGRKANLACTAITRWMPRDDWWMCFGLPSNSKNRLIIARFGGCIQLDTTVFTNRHGCSLLFVVGVDDENRSCILGRGLLRSECTETFEWILNRYEAAAGGSKPKVILTDADLAMTAAMASCWPGTLHLHCLWHVFKNVFKNCSSSFANNDDKTDMMRCFRNAAYAATPEVFATQVARLEQLVAGKKCEGYIADLIKIKTKWAFCCRPIVLTLGMVAIQRTEGLFGVAKRSGVDKKLSLCALWDRLQRLSKMIAIETVNDTPPCRWRGFPEYQRGEFLQTREAGAPSLWC
ncbi:unnamed protein product [Ectocarpus sp. 6 AP-2014]